MQKLDWSRCSVRIEIAKTRPIKRYDTLHNLKNETYKKDRERNRERRERQRENVFIDLVGDFIADVYQTLLNRYSISGVARVRCPRLLDKLPAIDGTIL